MIDEIVRKNRSYRRFDAEKPLGIDLLVRLIDLARLCPSSRNQQALKFMVFNKPEDNHKIFPCLSWAGYLKDWDGPPAEEQPSGYVIILGDTTLGTKFETDLGIVAQTMMLGAVEAGYGGCMISSINRAVLREVLKIQEHLEILLVLALGVPLEEVSIVPVKEGDIRYWRVNQVHYVPKRSLNEILIDSNQLIYKD